MWTKALIIYFINRNLKQPKGGNQSGNQGSNMIWYSIRPVTLSNVVGKGNRAQRYSCSLMCRVSTKDLQGQTCFILTYWRQTYTSIFWDFLSFLGEVSSMNFQVAVVPLKPLSKQNCLSWVWLSMCKKERRMVSVRKEAMKERSRPENLWRGSV